MNNTGLLIRLTGSALALVALFFAWRLRAPWLSLIAVLIVLVAVALLPRKP